MGHEILGNENRRPTLLDTEGDVPVTLRYKGVEYTYPLREWFLLCPMPHEQMDPDKVDEVARKFLKGINPFEE